MSSHRTNQLRHSHTEIEKSDSKDAKSDSRDRALNSGSERTLGEIRGGGNRDQPRMNLRKTWTQISPKKDQRQNQQEVERRRKLGLKPFLGGKNWGQKGIKTRWGKKGERGGERNWVRGQS